MLSGIVFMMMFENRQAGMMVTFKVTSSVLGVLFKPGPDRVTRIVTAS